MAYQLTTGDTILRLADNAFIPPDPANTDYAAYLEWVEAGNTPLPDPDEKPYTWDQALSKRNAALTASDWTMIPGCTVDQHAWAVYRQVLRDIPQTFAGCDPLEIVWPEKPSTAGPNTRKEEEAVPVETPANVVEEHAIEASATVERVIIEPAEATIDTTEEA
jgi:hypothetical protein